MLPVETNILIFEVGGNYTAKSFTEALAQNNILAFDISLNQVRMVTHLGITKEMVENLIGVIESL
jgi:threonine aldolase